MLQGNNNMDCHRSWESLIFVAVSWVYLRRTTEYGAEVKVLMQQRRRKAHRLVVFWEQWSYFGMKTHLVIISGTALECRFSEDWVGEGIGRVSATVSDWHCYGIWLCRVCLGKDYPALVSNWYACITSSSRASSKISAPCSSPAVSSPRY